MGIFGAAKRGFGMLGRKGKVGKTITSVKPAKNLKEKFDHKQDMFKAVDKAGPNLSAAEKGRFKKEGAAEIDRINKKYGR